MDISELSLHSGHERLTLEYLKLVSQDVEKLYTDVVEAVKTKKFLPNTSMAILQHLLQTTKHYSIQHALERRLRLIKQRQIGILIAGQVDAGKSTFINILMGGQYLPMRLLPTTKLICELQHSDYDPYAILIHKDRCREHVRTPLSTNPETQEWNFVRHCIVTKSLDGVALSRVVIYWKLTLDTDQTEVKQAEGYGFLSQMSQPFACQKSRASSSITDAVAKEQEVKQLFAPAQTPAAAAATAAHTPDEHEQNSSCRNRIWSVFDAETGHDFVDGFVPEDDVEFEKPPHRNEGGFSFVFLDTPGVQSDEAECNRRPIINRLSMCHTFIYVIDAHQTVHQKGLLSLMDDIERHLAEQTAVMSPDNALFVFNKTDLIPAETLGEVTKTIVEMLREKWHFLSEDNIIKISSKKILEETSPSRRQSKEKVELFKKLQSFLLKSTFLLLEEHLLWLLDLFDVARAMIQERKRLNKANLAKHLKDIRRSNFIALEKLWNIKDQDIIEEMHEKLKNLVDNSVDKLSNETFTEIACTEKESAIDGKEWKEIIERIDRAVCKNICIVVFKDVNTIKKLRQEYDNKMADRYKATLTHMKQVDKRLHGLLEDNSDVNGSLLSFVSSLLVTVLVRVPTRMKFAFLLLPYLSIPLIAKGLYEEYKDSVQENQRHAFLENPEAFLKERSSVISEELTTSPATGSRLFQAVFGQPIKFALNDLFVKTEDSIQYVIDGSVKCSDEQKETINRLMTQSMMVYTQGLMTKDIQPSDLQFHYDEHDLRKVIDQGPRSFVYAATYKDNGKVHEVAVKEVRFINVGKIEESDLCRDDFKECLIMRRLATSHPHKNVVKFYGCDVRFENNTGYIRLVLERCIGNLNTVIRNNEILKSDVDTRRRSFLHYAQQCTAGLAYLHEKNLIHRDIKPANFLLKSNGQELASVVITDMGSAKNEDRVLMSRDASNVYLACEIIRGRGFHTVKSDVYSLGLVFWELWFREPVFRNSNVRAGFQPDTFPPKSVQDIRQLLLDCLDLSPKARPNAQTVLKRLEEMH